MTPATQRVLILGADGFVGRHVVRSLSTTDGSEVVAAVRRPVAAARAGAASSRIRADATDEAALRRLLPDFQAVVNCVAGSADTIVASTRAVFSAAASCAQPPRVIHLSTMSVYGSATGHVDEDTSLNGDLGAYSAAKVEAEQIARTYPHAVILRPGCIYGGGSPQWSGRIARLLQARRLGDLGAAGDGVCNLVHIDDVVSAVLLALRHAEIEGQAFNLSTPAAPSWNEYFVRYAKALGATPVRRVTRRRLKLETRLLAPPLKIAEILAQRAHLGVRALPPPIPPSLLSLWQQEIRLDVSKAHSWLGLRFKPLEEGLAEAAACYRI